MSLNCLIRLTMFMWSYGSMIKLEEWFRKNNCLVCRLTTRRQRFWIGYIYTDELRLSHKDYYVHMKLRFYDINRRRVSKEQLSLKSCSTSCQNATWLYYTCHTKSACTFNQQVKSIRLMFLKRPIKKNRSINKTSWSHILKIQWNLYYLDWLKFFFFK